MTQSQLARDTPVPRRQELLLPSADCGKLGLHCYHDLLSLRVRTSLEMCSVVSVPELCFGKSRWDRHSSKARVSELKDQLQMRTKIQPQSCSVQVCFSEANMWKQTKHTFAVPK